MGMGAWLQQQSVFRVLREQRDRIMARVRRSNGLVKDHEFATKSANLPEKQQQAEREREKECARDAERFNKSREANEARNAPPPPGAVRANEALERAKNEAQQQQQQKQQAVQQQQQAAQQQQQQQQQQQAAQQQQQQQVAQQQQHESHQPEPEQSKQMEMSR